jgi:hypothetical protein
MNVSPSLCSWPLLLCLLLVPRVALAIQDTPITPASPSTAQDSTTGEAPRPASGLPGTDEPAPLGLMEPSLKPERKRIHPVLRILAETGAGLLTSAGGLVLGGWAPGALRLCASTGCIVEMFIGAFTGASIGFPLGVWWGGAAVGRGGQMLLSMLGMGVGLSVGVGTGIFVEFLPSFQLPLVVNMVLGCVLFFPLGAIGSVVAYELSPEQEASSQSTPLGSPRPRIQPLLSISPRGVQLGLGGTF